MQVGSEQLRQFLPKHTTFQPDMTRHGRLQKRGFVWQNAVQLARAQKSFSLLRVNAKNVWFMRMAHIERRI
ncbi:GlpK [Enterobacter sp. FY-07]|uniref:hypothetical protein n=1 Tax=Kosakonia oryzendophytica TaxID=1005665 RepID=UPI00077778C5|nr:hypothetical protein [Kosakonia oryzendophytica]AMO50086.1 GlpK [Enterobacter sp. FY-07]WBT57082.1 hypothetical protein O9K67_18270 [Kosakonia oryzendophytica]